MMISKSRAKSAIKTTWGKVLSILLFGILAAIVGVVATISSKYIRQEASSIIDGVTYSCVFFFLGAYFRLITIEKYDEKVYAILSSPWLKVAQTFRIWNYAFIAWFVFLPIRAFLLGQILKTNFGLIDLLWVCFLYLLLFSLCIYSVTVYVPSSQFLASPKVKIEKKKEVADALTVLTPVLGFPWLLSLYLALTFTNIVLEPYWMNYVVMFSIYMLVFFFSIDLPFCFSIRDKKKKELGKLEKERTARLKRLRKIKDGSRIDLWRKLGYEMELARIDREKQEIESRRTHPYKIVIPFASFFLGIFGAILIELIKQLIRIA